MTRVQMGNMGDDLDVFGSFYAVQVRSYVGKTVRDNIQRQSEATASSWSMVSTRTPPEANVMGFSLGQGSVRLTFGLMTTRPWLDGD